MAPAEHNPRSYRASGNELRLRLGEDVVGEAVKRALGRVPGLPLPLGVCC